MIAEACRSWHGDAASGRHVHIDYCVEYERDSYESHQAARQLGADLRDELWPKAKEVLDAYGKETATATTAGR